MFNWMDEGRKTHENKRGKKTRTEEWSDRKDGRERRKGRKEGRKEGWMDRWMDGRKEGRKEE